MMLSYMAYVGVLLVEMSLVNGNSVAAELMKVYFVAVSSVEIVFLLMFLGKTVSCYTTTSLNAAVHISSQHCTALWKCL